MAGSTVCAFAAAIVWHTHRTTAETEAQAPTKGVPSSQGIQTDSNPSPFICQVEEAREGRGQARELRGGTRHAQPVTVLFVTRGRSWCRR